MGQSWFLETTKLIYFLSLNSLKASFPVISFAVSRIIHLLLDYIPPSICLLAECTSHRHKNYIVLRLGTKIIVSGINRVNRR